jgi:hypothetical protein
MSHSSGSSDIPGTDPVFPLLQVEVVSGDFTCSAQIASNCARLDTIGLLDMNGTAKVCFACFWLFHLEYEVGE